MTNAPFQELKHVEQEQLAVVDGQWARARARAHTAVTQRRAPTWPRPGPDQHRPAVGRCEPCLDRCLWPLGRSSQAYELLHSTVAKCRGEFRSQCKVRKAIIGYWCGSSEVLMELEQRGPTETRTLVRYAARTDQQRLLEQRGHDFTGSVPSPRTVLIVRVGDQASPEQRTDHAIATARRHE